MLYLIEVGPCPPFGGTAVGTVRPITPGEFECVTPHPVSRLFVTEHEGAAGYEIEFDIVHGRVAFISAATKHVIETFGECA